MFTLNFQPKRFLEAKEYFEEFQLIANETDDTAAIISYIKVVYNIHKILYNLKSVDK